MRDTLDFSEVEDSVRRSGPASPFDSLVGSPATPTYLTEFLATIEGIEAFFAGRIEFELTKLDSPTTNLLISTSNTPQASKTFNFGCVGTIKQISGVSTTLSTANSTSLHPYRLCPRHHAELPPLHEWPFFHILFRASLVLPTIQASHNDILFAALSAVPFGFYLVVR